jgi:hypothetical protein
MPATVDTSVSPLLAVRTALAADIEAAVGWTCYPSPTEGFATPCVILSPGGWTQATSLWSAYTVTVSCVVANQGGSTADDVEEVARLVANAIIATGQWGVPEVPEPGAFTVNERQYAGVQFAARSVVTIEGI